MSLNEIVANATWAAPFVGAAIVLFVSMVLKKNKLRNAISVGSLFVSAISSTLLLKGVLESSIGLVQFSIPWIPAINVEFGLYIDTLAAFMALIVTWLCFVIGVYSVKYMEDDSGLSRYWFFFSFFTGSMLLIVFSSNLLLTFIGWEGTSLASYALIGHWFTDQKKNWVGDPGKKALGTSMEFAPSHSGVRALVFTRLGDVGFIAGIALIYALTGSLSIPDMAQSAATWGTALAVRGLLLPFLLFFSLGAFAKSAQFPFHEWLVTAMTGPTSISALIHAATMVKAGVFFMLRFTPIFFLVFRALSSTMPDSAADVTLYFTIVVYIGTFTAFLMATQAIVAKELKLVLAFSTVSQLGYMFMAAGSAGLIPDFAGGFIATFGQLMSHGVFKASLFLAAGAVIHAVGSRFMSEMGGLSKYMKLTFIAVLVSALSLAGLPPLIGFWTKDSLIETVYQTGLIVPIVLAIGTVAITAFYSARLVMKTFQTQPSENALRLAEKHELHKPSLWMSVPYFVLALASIVLGAFWFFFGGDFYTALTRNVLGLAETPVIFQVSLDPLTTGLSLTMVAVGLTLAYVIYGKTNFQKTIARQLDVSRVFKAIHSFLYNRWYIQAIYYKVFVYGGGKLSKGLFKWFDTGALDGFYHRFIPWFATKTYKGGFRIFETGGVDRLYNRVIVKAALSLSNSLRKIQTGKINHYLLLLLIGFIILVVLFLWGAL
ncbi:MAG TPA: NADH-quinone oxidoreductase subunit L [Candidatus Bathyarchaeia archaeon]|nr:NADH-quinone oxidoreductase subunit L [Candidatus Bathyarchaeia archaeon]